MAMAIPSPIPIKDASTALIHLYRGELGRMTAYRARLDATTNWAVGATAAMASFTLGDPAVPHFVLLLAAVLVVVFLGMEARRYRFYELVRQRVRLLETGFYGDILGQGRPGWKAKLHESLMQPRAPISPIEAISQRLRRNYLWLILVLSAAWGLKLAIHGKGSFFAAAQAGPFPGAVVVGGVLLVLLAAVILSLSYRQDERE